MKNTETNILKIGKGLLLSLGITVVLLLLFSLVLAYSNIQENTIAPVIIVITVISILIGSGISMSKLKKNGIVNGGMVGLLYILILYGISSCFSGSFGLEISSIIIMTGGILAGAIGGVIAVNRK